MKMPSLSINKENQKWLFLAPSKKYEVIIDFKDELKNKFENNIFIINAQ